MKKLAISLLLILSVMLFLVSCSEAGEGGLDNDVVLTFKNNGSYFGEITVPAGALGSSFYGYLGGRNMTSTTDVAHKFSVGLGVSGIGSTTILIGTTSTDLYYFTTSQTSSSGSDGIKINTPMPSTDTILNMFKVSTKK